MSVALSGLSSGIDTASIINQLVALEREPITRLDRREAVENARKTGYGDIKTKLAAFRTAVQGLKDFSTFALVQKVSSSNETVLGATRTDGAAAGGYSVTINSLARAEQWKADVAFTAASGSDTLRISVGGGAAVGVSIANGDNLQTIASKINSTSNVGVYASVVNGQLYFSGRQTGAAQTISVTSDATLSTQMGFGGGAAVQTQAAANASVTVDGVTHTTYASNTIEGLIAGVKLNLKATGTAGVTVSEPAVDEDAVSGKVKAFVDAYNDVLRTINTKVNEKPVKAADIKNNVDAAKGAMYNDSTLTALATKLRNEVGHIVSGLGAGADRWSALGVSVAAASATTSEDGRIGILNFNKDKFIAAYNANPTDVKNFLSNTTGDPATEGISQYLERKIVTPYLQVDTGVMDTAVKGRQSILDGYSRQKSRVEERAEAYRAMLQKQFSAMETALSLLNSQSSSLMSQLSSLGT